jgi:DNA-directed RNA polymerase specialized sigma24 family protein
MRGHGLDLKAMFTDEQLGRLSVRLKRYAFATIRHRSWEEAEDLAQGAFLNVIDPKLRTWDPELEPDLFTHLKALVRSEESRRRKTYRRRRETPYEEEVGEGQSTAAEAGVHDDEATPANNPYTPSHEAKMHRDEGGRRVFSLLRERYPKDEMIVKVVGCLERHIETMAEQAAEIGCTMMEVRNARDRLWRYVKKIEAELDDEGKGGKGGE